MTLTAATGRFRTVSVGGALATSVLQAMRPVDRSPLCIDNPQGLLELNRGERIGAHIAFRDEKALVVKDD